MGSPDTRHPSRGYVRFVLNRAAHEHNAGRPHKAWEIIDRAGLGDHYPVFLREGLKAARRRFETRLAAQ